MGILRTDKISGLEREKGQNPNLVANGDFSDSSIAGWTAYNAVVSHDSGAGGRLKVDDSAAAGGWSNAAYVVNTEPGASYRFEVRCSASDSDSHYVGYYQGTYDTAGTAPTVYSSEITVNPSVHHFNFIATGTTVTIMLIANGAGVVYFDDVSVRKTDGNSIGGSVHFDGNDHLSIGASGNYNFLHNGATDWTAEFWAKMPSVTRGQVFGTGASSAQTGFSLTLMSSADNQSDKPGVFAMFGRGAAGNYRYWGANSGLSINTWHHIAAVFKSSDKTLALYIDGREVDNDSGTENGTFGSGNYSTSNSSYAFIVGKNIHGNTFYKGYISNLRVVAGRRLYTSDFTPPVHELEPIDGTRILCCNNPDSVTAVSNAGIGTGHIGTSAGNPQNSTENPGFTRDFTSGTEFRGVTTFDTQGYFVPPSGTTEQRGRGRGVFSVGSGTPASTGSKNIEYVQISSSGNGIDFGDLSEGSQSQGAVSSTTRSVISLGDPVPAAQTNILEFITIATTGDAVDFGDMTTKRSRVSGVSSPTRGVYIGGTNELVSPYGGSAVSYTDTMDYITIASLGNAISFGETDVVAAHGGSVCNSTRGVIANNFNGSSATNTMEYITIATTGDAKDFGDLTRTETYLFRGCSGSNSTRGIFSGGYNGGIKNIIDYITITSTGNAIDFGDLTLATRAGSTTSNSIRTMFFGGYNASNGGRMNIISYVNIMSTGNAQEFGDCKERGLEGSGSSDSHGGLS